MCGVEWEYGPAYRDRLPHVIVTHIWVMQGHRAKQVSVHCPRDRGGAQARDSCWLAYVEGECEGERTCCRHHAEIGRTGGYRVESMAEVDCPKGMGGGGGAWARAAVAGAERRNEGRRVENGRVIIGSQF